MSYQIGSGVLLPGAFKVAPPAVDTFQIRNLIEIPSASPINYHLDKIDRIGTDQGGLDLDPPYQRGHVWSPEQASAFVGYLLKGGKCPLIWVNRYEDERTGGKDYLYRPASVIDGKQRITALIRWVQDEIAANLYGRDIWYHELSVIDRRGLPFLDVIYVNMTERDQMRLYLNLNGGIAHTAEELERVRTLVNDGYPSK